MMTLVHSLRTGALGAATMLLGGEVLAPEHFQFVATLSVGVGVVVAAIAWIDGRIEHKLLSQFSAHNEADQLRMNALRTEMRLMIAQIRETK